MFNEAFIEQNWLLLLILIVWTFVWKGMALWRAAENDAKGWFAVLLVINTLGVLPILYLYVFGKKDAHTVDEK